MTRLSIAGSALAVSLLPHLGEAATYKVYTEFSSHIGTFEAPLGGGLVSDLLITQSGVLFDIRTDAGGPFQYDPIANDFTGLAQISYTNSADYPGICGPMLCGMILYPLPGDPTTPGDILAIDEMLNNIDEGTRYLIDPDPIDAPVPLPPAVAGLAAALVGMAALRRGRRA